MRATAPGLRLARAVLYVQGAVYVVTGLWPVVHLASFEFVTGEKYDDFLVHTVGLLLFVVGAALLRALRAGHMDGDLAAIAPGTALVLCTIDVVYWANGRLAPIYLLDAAVELVFFAAGVAWLVAARAARRR